MQDIQMVIEALFSSFLNITIFLLAIANAYIFYQAYKNIKELKTELFQGDSLLKRYFNEKTSTPEKLEDRILTNFTKWEQMYQKSTRWYHLFTTIIAVFPLLGIVGTVWGIIPTLSDLSQINASFSLALVSTLLGVIFSVFYKVCEGLISGDYALVSERVTLLTEDVTRHIMEKENSSNEN